MIEYTEALKGNTSESRRSEIWDKSEQTRGVLLDSSVVSDLTNTANTVRKCLHSEKCPRVQSS